MLSVFQPILHWISGWINRQQEGFSCFCLRGSRCFLSFFEHKIFRALQLNPYKWSCFKILLVFWGSELDPILAGEKRELVPYDILRSGPAALHCSLVDGLGFETWWCRSCPTGHDMYKRQRAVTQLRLRPSRNFIGGVCCQICHWARRETCPIRWGKVLQWLAMGESSRKRSAASDSLRQEPASLGLCFH